ncbi:DNA polymerase Y family protein [Catenulispora sp. GP43]|uniref:DNA polymerase Y family protein n=1 Tax=Catenulispora sp. GP43 TaxID=3156263 RepID=UPI003511363F
MSAPPAVPDRALAVWCPDWPVVAVGADPDTAAAVVVKGVIVACSPAARVEGVRRGQRTRDAQRLAPELILHARDEAAEARAFEPVLAVLADFTPRFEVVRPGLAALPVEGPARYFGGEDLVVRAIRDRIGDEGVGAGVGVADGVFAAALAARSDTRVVPGRTAEFLASFPTSVLELPELVEPLARLGVQTLGRLAELPADAMTGRFGAAGVAAHRLARGLDAQPPAPLRQGPDLSVEAVFDPPADGSERIVFAAKALADELHTVLAQAGVAGVRVAVEIHGAAGPGAEPEVSYRLWRHEGLLSSTAVAERVRWQLSGWQTVLQAGNQTSDTAAGSMEAGAAAATGVQAEAEAPHADRGITRLRLIPDHLVPARGVQPGLWGADEAPDRIARAAERLQAMYGPNAVTLPADAGGRGPADQGVRTPYGDLPPQTPEPAPWPAALPAPAPADVPRAPRPAEVVDAAGRAVGVSGRLRISAGPAQLVLPETGERLRILSWAGPWPLAERWWEPGRAVRRARFQAVTDDGRAWLLGVQDGRWSVEAVYD